MAKQKCENSGDSCNPHDMIATPDCEWICSSCFAEDPKFYGYGLELDGDDE